GLNSTAGGFSNTILGNVFLHNRCSDLNGHAAVLFGVFDSGTVIAHNTLIDNYGTALPNKTDPSKGGGVRPTQSVLLLVNFADPEIANNIIANSSAAPSIPSVTAIYASFESTPPVRANNFHNLGVVYS